MIRTIKNHNDSGKRNGKSIRMMMLMTTLTLTVFFLAPASWAAKTDKKSTSIMGSGKQYTTVVERQTQGNLTTEDFRQVSTLGSQIIGHLNKATDCLEYRDVEKASGNLEKISSLVKIIRDMLPTTTVTTIVKDAKGKEVYRSTDKVQDDLVPIYQKMTAVDVVKPIIDAKSRAAESKGLELADAEFVKTSVLLDLTYVENKIKRAQCLLKKEPEKALDALLLAQLNGIRFSVREEDSSLIKAQRALRLAERMLSEQKMEGAKWNLHLAKLYLDTYATYQGQEKGKEVKNLQKEIEQLMQNLDQKDSASKIRDLWSCVTSWFESRPGQTHQTSQPAKSK